MGLENGKSQTDSPLIGKRIGRLTILSTFRENGRNYCFCLCDCGKKKAVRFDHLLSERVVSCGCYHAEKQSKISATHGMSHTRIYRIWKNMRRRCDSPCLPQYKDWGGRGITVCKEWQTFESFYEWAIANGYRDDLSIDRIDNDGDYTPENCRWVTPKDQANNRRSNKLLSFGGETHNIEGWCKITGLPRRVVDGRLSRGWSVEKTLTTPILTKGGKVRES